MSLSDTTRRYAVELPRSLGFEMSLAPGPWRVSAYRDIDRNRRWDPGEPASDPIELTLAPAAELKDLVLVLKRPPG
jgi:hypothetical protein